MAMLGRNWLEEGYYEEDDYGSFTRLRDVKDILQAQARGVLYENDGMSTTRVSSDTPIDSTNVIQPTQGKLSKSGIQQLSEARALKSQSMNHD